MTGGVLLELETRLRERLAGTLPGLEAQLRFMPTPPRTGWKPGEFPADARLAAGLLLLYPGARGASIALTVRASGLSRHAGQVSLPGGATDPGETLAQAALREAHEEIGLEARYVSVIGYLPDHVVISGFRVTPVVARVAPGFELHIARQEVDEVFEAPLAYVFDARNQRPRRHRFGGTRVEIELPDIPYGGHNIWGATAGMLVTLQRLCCGELDDEPA